MATARRTHPSAVLPVINHHFLVLSFLITPPPTHPRTTFLFIKLFRHLNSVVKSYFSVILPDIVMCINFLPRDILHLAERPIKLTRWAAGSLCAAPGHWVS
jgi:hypothetical protein